MIRKIIHIDMDAFYASVEQRDFPELKGKCIAVGGASDRGVVATASYEARKFGVKSAMSTVVARQKCPDLIIVPPRFEVYQQVSGEIREIFREYTDLVEPLSLDEAYLDVTENHKNISIATQIATEIKEKIKNTTGLTASAGVSYNKFLAKIASDFRKPDGLFVITPQKAAGIIDQLPIERFHGIGRVTAEKMKKFGIFTGFELKTRSQEWLMRNFGKAGRYYFQVANGEDERQVISSYNRKSVGAENTFSVNLTAYDDLASEVIVLTEKVWNWVNRKKTYGRTVTLKMKFHDFSIINRSKSMLYPIKKYEHFEETAKELLLNSHDPSRPVRLLGVSLSNLSGADENGSGQLRLDFDIE